MFAHDEAITLATPSWNLRRSTWILKSGQLAGFHQSAIILYATAMPPTLQLCRAAGSGTWHGRSLSTRLAACAAVVGGRRKREQGLLYGLLSSSRAVRAVALPFGFGLLARNLEKTKEVAHENH